MAFKVMLGDAMKSHAQYCPVARAADILNQKWTLLIFRDLLAGATRFNELRRGVPRMSPTLLSRRLKQLESQGLIERRVAPESGTIEYHPTPAGLEVGPIVELYGIWGQRWVRNRLGNEELDVSLLMWAMRCSIERRHFHGRRTVVQFEFTDRPRLKKANWWLDRWWLVVTADETDLCIQDPGHEVDLYVSSDLATMTRVSMGDIPVRQAVRSKAIRLLGSRSLARSFERWLPRSRFSDVTQPPEPPNLEHFLDLGNSGPA
ncbi:MAG: helix-turn-helix domain-containing protein [Wenzhouxiangellaceae bacterium]|nr:helix-turn-helix domain-containing protein [Wenzhouxiangellaceae bacterium]